MPLQFPVLELIKLLNKTKLMIMHMLMIMAMIMVMDTIFLDNIFYNSLFVIFGCMNKGGVLKGSKNLYRLCFIFQMEFPPISQVFQHFQ